MAEYSLSTATNCVSNIVSGSAKTFQQHRHWAGGGEELFSGASSVELDVYAAVVATQHATVQRLSMPISSISNVCAMKRLCPASVDSG